MTPRRGRDLVEALLQGDRAALARVISAIENGSPEARLCLRRIHAAQSRGFRIGVTGPPGVGKSVLVGCLAARMREAGRRVGIIAVDPTSPFTGGAMLGDGNALRDAIAGDEGV